MRDALTRKGLSVGAFSIDVNTISLLGEPGVTATPMILGNAGVAQFNANPSLTNMGDLIEALNGETEMESGVFADWYSDVLLKSLSHNQLLYDTLEDSEFFAWLLSTLIILLLLTLQVSHNHLFIIKL